MNIKVIQTEEQYHSYLEEVEKLLSLHRSLLREEKDRLDLLTVLIESYENRKYPVEPPDPIDAILFRMEEKGLKQADLIPYFGTSSRVSEILNRKRPLTVQMMRAVSLGLGISADTLLGLSQITNEVQPEGIDWSKFPIREMLSRGWLEGIITRSREPTEDLVKTYISSSGIRLDGASFRRTLSGEAESPSTRYALYAWLARVIQRSRERRSRLGRFHESGLSASFLRDLAQLSWSDKGPLLAIEYLERNGIAVVIEPQLRGSRLDGAALKDVDKTPIIGLTLRFDRLDSFWFTLLHEAAHVWKHIADATETFVDDLEIESEDRREAEANRLAQEAFIPRMIWRRSDACVSPSKDSVERLSRELKIHPSIIVGRIHKETGNYSILSDYTSHSRVKNILSIRDE